jgi:hypothetical protein
VDPPCALAYRCKMPIKERGDSGIYYITLWPLAAFTSRLEAAGFQVEWVVRSADDDGNWMTLLAKKRP